MITHIPRSSFSANVDNTARTNEHQTLSESFYKELEDKSSGKELAMLPLKSFSENCRQSGRHIFNNEDFVIKFSTSVLQADKKGITIVNKNENTTLTQTIAPIFEEYLMEILPQRSDTLDKQELNLKSDRKEKESLRIRLNGQYYFPRRPRNRIVCRHVAAQYINDIYQSIDYKPHQDDHSPAGEFLTRFNRRCKDQILVLISSHPKGRCVATYGNFGLVMKAYFDKMGSNGISVMAAILLVDNHALTIRLKVKNTTERCAHYVVSVYDPSVTNDKIRIMSESKEDIRHYSLMSLMNVGYSLLKWSNDHIINRSVAIIPVLPKEQLSMLKGSMDEVAPPLSSITMNLLIAVGQNHQLTQLVIQFQEMSELHKTEMLTAYNNGHMNVINTILSALPILFNTFKFDKKSMKPLLLANNPNEYPGLFSTAQHKQRNVVETVYLALSNHTRLSGFTAKDIMGFWQHKAPQKYSILELAFELGHRVIARLILNTLNKTAESFGFTDNPRYIVEKNYMEALLREASPHTVR